MPSCLLKLIAVFITGSLLLGTPLPAVAQAENKPSVQIGTQIPIQYTLGFQMPVRSIWSVRVQIGVLAAPYDRWFFRTMEWFGLKENDSRLIQESFETGLLGSLGANYHIRKYYVGLYGQYARLQGSTTAAKALPYVDYDLSTLEPQWIALLDQLTIHSRSHLFNANLLIGRAFQLPNPKFALNTEIGLTKVLGTSNQFRTDNEVIEQTPIVQEWYRQLDDRFQKYYWKYGVFPSVNVYVTYHF